HYDDISRTNMTIHVRETKGRIDRYTILSQKNLDLLTEYWYKCGRPKDIFFPNSWSGGYLDIASVNQFFKKSAKLAGINRHVSSLACRQSFASHLFESGTDIKYIQSLLGHVDPRSTDVYLHVSNKTLLGIRSPFDNPEGGES
ncbi:integrase, partial [Dorea formicigenerans]